MFNGTDLCGVKDGSINIQNFDFKDVGTYYCYANNSEGGLRASLVVGVTAGTAVPTPTGKRNYHALHAFLWGATSHSLTNTSSFAYVVAYVGSFRVQLILIVGDFIQSAMAMVRR